MSFEPRFFQPAALAEIVTSHMDSPERDDVGIAITTPNQVIDLSHEFLKRKRTKSERMDCINMLCQVMATAKLITITHSLLRNAELENSRKEREE